MCTPAQGTSSFTSARSMIHGVWPPLTAEHNGLERPQRHEHRRRSSAAAARATESASSNNSSLMFYAGVATRKSSCVRSCSGYASLREAKSAGHLTRDPRCPFRIRRSACRPSASDRRFARPPRHNPRGKQRGVPGHGVAQHALVRIHLFRTGMTAGDHFDRFAFQHLTFGPITVVPMAMVISGLMRNRRWLRDKAASPMTAGGFRNRATTSVQVTGKFFPARM